MWLLVWLLYVASVLTDRVLARECQDVVLTPMCREYNYNRAWLPNTLNHNSTEEADFEMHQFFPLVRVECSQSLRPLLCLVYLPPCDHDDVEIIPPCRELCQSARSGCEPLMMKFGFRWPDPLSCDKLPAIADGATCRNDTDSPPITAAVTTAATQLSDIPAPTTELPSEDDGATVDEQPHTSSACSHSKSPTSSGNSGGSMVDVNSEQALRTLQKLEQAADALISFLEKAEVLIPLAERNLNMQNRKLRLTTQQG